MHRRRDCIVRPPHPAEQGFLIIGVVMFVLALTIIGLSLFSLSSFEAQFLGRSTQSTQAFYAATGGIERAMNVLDDTDSLQSVFESARDYPMEHVVYARAAYEIPGGLESTGVVPWDGATAIHIRVVAEVGGVRRAVEAWYRASKYDGLYSNLVTTSTVLVVADSSTSPLPMYFGAATRTFIAGKVVQRVNDASWMDSTQNALGLPHDYQFVPSTQPPDAGGFIGTHLGSAVEPVSTASSYSFRGIPPDPGFRFFLPGQSYDPPASEDGFAFYNDVGEIALNVDPGRAIWLLPGGGYFAGKVTINGDPEASTLVIVATAGSNTDIHPEHPALPLHTGLWFEGGIMSNIPLILVSDGTIAVSHYSSDHRSNTIVPFLSVFAGGIYLQGPRAGFNLTALHPPREYQSWPFTDDKVLGPLYEDDLLPNAPTNGGRAKFTLEPGTWREVTESNPS